MRRLAILSVLLMFQVLPAVADPTVSDLSRQLAAKDAAMLDMQNKINEQDSVIRGLRGSIEEMRQQIDIISQNVDALKSNQAAQTSVQSSSASVSADNNVAASNTAAAVPVANSNSADTATPSTNYDGNDRKAYDSAYALIQAGNLNGAADAFTSFLNSYADSALAANAYYWIGQIKFKQQQYVQARQSFLKVSQYKNSSKRGEAIFKLGVISEAQNDTERAKKFYMLVKQSYPESTEAVLAEKALTRLN